MVDASKRDSVGPAVDLRGGVDDDPVRRVAREVIRQSDHRSVFTERGIGDGIELSAIHRLRIRGGTANIASVAGRDRPSTGWLSTPERREARMIHHDGTTIASHLERRTYREGNHG